MDEFKEIRESIKELEKRVIELEKDKSLQEFQYNSIMATLQDMKEDIKAIKETPSTRWNLIIGGVITATIAAIVSLLFKL